MVSNKADQIDFKCSDFSVEKVVELEKLLTKIFIELDSIATRKSILSNAGINEDFIAKIDFNLSIDELTTNLVSKLKNYPVSAQKTENNPLIALLKYILHQPEKFNLDDAQLQLCQQIIADIEIKNIPQSANYSIQETNNNPVINDDNQDEIQLENPDSQVPLNSPFYIQRSDKESDYYDTILESGALIRIKAPEKMGKTSLMSRILDNASQQDYQTVSIDLWSPELLTDIKTFLQWFCATVSEALNLEVQLEKYCKKY